MQEYSGGRHVAEWYDRFRALCERRGVDFVSVLPERLTGAAYATWAGLSPQEQASAASVRAALLDAYMPSWTDAFDEFQARRLQPGETVEEYLKSCGDSRLCSSTAQYRIRPKARNS